MDQQQQNQVVTPIEEEDQLNQTSVQQQDTQSNYQEPNSSNIPPQNETEQKMDQEIQEQQKQQMEEEAKQVVEQQDNLNMQIEELPANSEQQKENEQEQQAEEQEQQANEQNEGDQKNQEGANEGKEGENTNENKNKSQKSKRNAFSIIQESNIIHGERLRVRNSSAATNQNLQLQKNPSQQGTKAGTSDSKCQKKNQQSGSGDLDALELLEIRKKQLSKEVGTGHSEHYMSKTPDIIIQLVDDLIKYDKIDCLRQQLVDKKLDEIPNISKYGDRKKKEDVTIKDLKGNILTIYYLDQVQLKKDEEEKKIQEQLSAKQAEQDKLNKQQQQQQQQQNQQQKQLDFEMEKDNIKMDDYSKDQFANLTPSKDIYFSNDSKRTPQKLLNEDIVLDDHHGIANQVQNAAGNDFVIEESNNHHDTALNSLINDELLRQLDDEIYDNNVHQDFSHMNQFDRQITYQNNLSNQPIQDNGFIEQNLGLIDGVNGGVDDQEKHQNYQIVEQYLTQLTEETKYMIDHTTITSLDRIRDRAIDNVYFSFEEVDKDFKKLFIHALYKRCNSKDSINYICNMIDNYISVVQRRAAKSKIMQTKLADLQKLFKLDLDNKFQVKNWPFIPTTHRTYECINQYCPEPPSNQDSIFETLRSEKKPVQCPEDCSCMSLYGLGSFSLELGTWNSECPNRRERIECTHHDCQNSQGIHGRQKVLGVDVKETLCWGIDQYTKKNLYYILPENEREDIKFRFIQCSLLKAANLLENDGWEMKKVCDFIIRNSESKMSCVNHDESKPKIKYIFSNSDRKFAKILSKAIELKVDPEAFRIHPKGMGVICINRNGIDQNDLIIKYIGEIYRPYRWFERQDFIKKYMKDNNQQDVLPDFYNIMLELHKNEVKGIDILYVDPMQKGNYSSRLSHSCDPNCGTVATISNGDYNISMFALKSIEYGEELAFDYSAVTESRNEHRQSTCLCGTQKCRGKYIEFNNNNQKEYNYILEKIQCFLKRNSDLLRSGSEPLTDEDVRLLEQYNLKQNVQVGCEKWLLKWISIILKSVGEEQELFFSDQLVTNRFIQFNDKEISLLEKAIEIKEKGGFEVYEAEENAKLEQENIKKQGEMQIENTNEVKDEENEITKQDSIKDIKEEGDDLKTEQEEKMEEEVCEKTEHNDEKIEEKIEEEAQKISNDEKQAENKQNSQDDKDSCLKSQAQAESEDENAENEEAENENGENKKSTPVKHERNEEEENNDDDNASIEQKDSVKKSDPQNKEDEDDNTEQVNEKDENQKEGEASSSKIVSETKIKAQNSSANKKKSSSSKKQKPKKPVKVKYTQEELDRLEEKQKIRELVEKNTIEVLHEKLQEKQKEKQKNIEYIKYLSNAKVENRIQNIIISLDKVKFYLNNVGDINPPLSYLSNKDIFYNLWGKVNKFQKKRRQDNQVLSIVEELMDLIKFYPHYKECQQVQKFIELFDPFMTKYVEESVEKALLAWRLFCLNIHYIFNDIVDPQFHAGALLITLYFYAFTHTYFTPHEYQPFNSEKMTISDTEMFNLELLDEDKKNTKKTSKKKNYEEQRSYSSQFIWGQLTVWFKQTVASPQATLSQDRRGTLSYPQLNQSFKTNVLTYPFQEKNDKTGRSTFLNHLKEKPKDMWPPEQAKWSFKNALKNYGTLLFEGVHSQNLIDNLIERVIGIIDGTFEEKMKLFIEVESKLSKQTEQDIQKIQNECFDVIKKQVEAMNFQTIEKSLEQLKQDQLIIQQQSNSVDPDSKMQLRTVRKKQKDQEDEDFFYGDILKKKPQFPPNQSSQSKIKESSSNIGSSTKLQEDKKEVQAPVELKKRRYNEFILNNEEQSFIEEDEDIEELIQNEDNLNKYLVIEINKSFITTQLPKIAIKMKKDYPSLLAPPTKKDHKISSSHNVSGSDKQKKPQQQIQNEKQKSSQPSSQSKIQVTPHNKKEQEQPQTQSNKKNAVADSKSTPNNFKSAKYQHQSLLNFSNSNKKPSNENQPQNTKNANQKSSQQNSVQQKSSEKSKQSAQTTSSKQSDKNHAPPQKAATHSHHPQESKSEIKQQKVESVTNQNKVDPKASDNKTKEQQKKKTPSKSSSSGQSEKGAGQAQQVIDDIEDLSAYRYHNEDSRKSVLSQASQNSQDSNQRRSHRATTQFDYNKLLGKKTKPLSQQNIQSSGQQNVNQQINSSQQINNNNPEQMPEEQNQTNNEDNQNLHKQQDQNSMQLE